MAEQSEARQRNNWPTYALVVVVGAWAMLQVVSNRSLPPVRCGYELIPDEDTVVMLSTSWCGYCRQARRFFQGENIKYCEYDVETDPEGKRRFAAQPRHGVPILILRGQAFHGFDRERVKEILVEKGMWGGGGSSFFSPSP